VTKFDLKKSFAIALAFHLTMGLSATFFSPRINVRHTPQIMEVMVLPPEPDEIISAAPETKTTAPSAPKVSENQPPPKFPETPAAAPKTMIALQPPPQPILLAESATPPPKAVLAEPSLEAHDAPRPPLSVPSDSLAENFAATQVNLASSASPGDADRIGPAQFLHAKFRNNSPPPYPPKARRRREEGVVLLHVIVTTSGRAREVRIAQTSGFPLLDDAARRAATAWGFEPAKEAGKSIESEVEIPVNFKLRDAR